ncbi:MAG TPA: gluconate 2-dehydrogenase subunit 3 family protein [Thermodesulfobacteriota bacterium]|nr:gluconate 2-dehydrogenase subunit 3 family protein [Thermodesulfobacteriota bacterium]
MDISDILTRRKFIGIITSFSVLSSLFPSNYLLSVWALENKNPLKSQKLLKDKFKFFTPYQATVIEEVTSLIIPSDNSPGAREAGVVFVIDNSMSENNRLQTLYLQGIEWLDLMSKMLSGENSFLDLNQDEMIEILNIADQKKSLLYKEANIPRVDRDKNIGSLFFDNLVRQTFNIFYTSDLGWKVVGYHGPPQWAGNLNYNKCNLK